MGSNDLNKPELGRLEQVDLRDFWKEENTDFTPWLAREENLKLLAKTVGIGLELHNKEVEVGSFRADIVCKDENEKWVVIENQLADTDHTHLGQLITYAATLGATTIIWIASRIRWEHRTAIDWLNKNTDEEKRFFALEIELWRIGKSLNAPKFNIISQPNEWEKKASQRMRKETLIEEFCRAYWQAFMEYLDGKNNLSFKKSPSNMNDQTFKSAKNNGVRLCGVIKTQKGKITVKIRIAVPEFYKALWENKEAIEKEIGEKLLWEELSNQNDSHQIILEKDADPKNESDKQNQFAWFKEKLEAFHNAFWHRIDNAEEKTRKC